MNNDFTHYSFIIPHYLVIPDVVGSNAFCSGIRAVAFVTIANDGLTIAQIDEPAKILAFMLTMRTIMLGSIYSFFSIVLLKVSSSEFLVSTSYNLPSPPPFREGLGVGFYFTTTFLPFTM